MPDSGNDKLCAVAPILVGLGMLVYAGVQRQRSAPPPAPPTAGLPDHMNPCMWWVEARRRRHGLSEPEPDLRAAYAGADPSVMDECAVFLDQTLDEQGIRGPTRGKYKVLLRQGVRAWGRPKKPIA